MLLIGKNNSLAFPLPYTRQSDPSTRKFESCPGKLLPRSIPPIALTNLFLPAYALLAIEDTDILDTAQLKNYLIERTTPGRKVSVKVRRIDADR